MQIEMLHMPVCDQEFKVKPMDPPQTFPHFLRHQNMSNWIAQLWPKSTKSQQFSGIDFTI